MCPRCTGADSLQLMCNMTVAGEQCVGGWLPELPAMRLCHGLEINLPTFQASVCTVQGMIKGMATKLFLRLIQKAQDNSKAYMAARVKNTRPDAKLACKAGEKLKNLFMPGDVDKVKVVHNKVFNLTTSEP
eukprot:3525364-Amphidinium_carterae.1